MEMNVIEKKVSAVSRLINRSTFRISVINVITLLFCLSPGWSYAHNGDHSPIHLLNSHWHLMVIVVTVTTVVLLTLFLSVVRRIPESGYRA